MTHTHTLDEIIKTLYDAKLVDSVVSIEWIDKETVKYREYGCRYFRLVTLHEIIDLRLVNKPNLEPTTNN